MRKGDWYGIEVCPSCKIRLGHFDVHDNNAICFNCGHTRGNAHICDTVKNSIKLDCTRYSG